MSSHPYWSYGPDAHGGPCPPEEYAKAIDEGRRAFALELAVKSFAPVGESTGPGDILSLADTFEDYLKGDA
jgi:hypothetical protein